MSNPLVQKSIHFVAPVNGHEVAFSITAGNPTPQDAFNLVKATIALENSLQPPEGETS